MSFIQDELGQKPIIREAVWNAAEEVTEAVDVEEVANILLGVAAIEPNPTDNTILTAGYRDLLSAVAARLTDGK